MNIVKNKTQQVTKAKIKRAESGSLKSSTTINFIAS